MVLEETIAEFKAACAVIEGQLGTNSLINARLTIAQHEGNEEAVSAITEELKVSNRAFAAALNRRNELGQKLVELLGVDRSHLSRSLSISA